MGPLYTAVIKTGLLWVAYRRMLVTVIFASHANCAKQLRLRPEESYLTKCFAVIDGNVRGLPLVWNTVSRVGQAGRLFGLPGIGGSHSVRHACQGVAKGRDTLTYRLTIG